jgi:glycosyltransferase involved in cell wall biosynthesis
MSLNPTQTWILIAYAAIVAAWPLRHLVVAWIFGRFDRLTPSSPRFTPAVPPLVSVVVPAKDEEATLADCLRTVSAQSYPHLEILVVDDRSSDATAEVARSMAAADPRIRVLTIHDLPGGWTGKNHAMQVACAEARGEWLWMLDADTRHHPDALAIVLEYARVHGAALASVMPEQRCGTFWEKVVQPLEGIVLMRSFSPLVVNDDRQRVGFANGQFVLMSRDAFDQVGGYVPVRDRFLEDIALAQRFKDARLPIRLAVGTEISSTRMYSGLSPLIRGWARILYDGLGRRPLPLVGKILEPLIFSQTGDVALLVALGLLISGSFGLFAQGLLGLSVIHQVLKTWLLWKMYRLSSPKTAHYALFYPLAGLVSAWISIRALEMCRTGRVTWRGTSYGSLMAAAPQPASSSTAG